MLKSTCQLLPAKCQRANTKCPVHALTTSPKLDHEAKAKANKKASDQAYFQARIRVCRAKEGLIIHDVPKPDPKPKKIEAKKSEWIAHVEACRAKEGEEA
jgi:hypothetical protein